MMHKSKEIDLELQEQLSRDRNAMAVRIKQEHMAYGELEAATTTTDLQAAMLASLRGMILATGSDPNKIEVVMSGIRYYGEAVRLEMMEHDIPDVFGTTLTDEERAYVIKMHP